ncbi:LacI family DNA-binding transcriptional regulator [Salisediminibacterium beveridgei]|uniref:Transcriptional repressor, LacI family n=1 Tax=Salisediminibacterium beveridgei TaxID=632773 RepID=A0A1D7QYS9_9BACI|nr:LacI family DNA-binding transcriptional regulator [Salisediminibacterium beveridgei]AOM84163.1 transcriptional repressor, LacI family [Salisediminibacterium beveridgei]
MVTINDVARLSGVSRTTVSRVLNKNGYVSEAVQAKVLRVIEETGYVPSEQAKSMRTKKTNVIGVILPRLSSETVSRVVEGIDHQLSTHGYQILLSNTNLDASKEAEHIRLLESRRVDGIILFGTVQNDEVIRAIQEARVPVVVLGQDLTPVASSVVYDDYQAARSVMDAIIQAGHRHVGFIGVEEADIAVGFERKRGYLDGMEVHGLPVNERWIQTADFTSSSGKTGFSELMKADQKPTAVFAVTDRLAIGAMQEARERGMEIPDDVAFISIGATEVANYVTPMLSTVDYEYENAGIRIATLMLEEINKPVKKTKKIVMKYGLLLRDSLQ